jgi:hypothetical protein
MIIKVINKVYTIQLININWDSDTVQEIDNKLIMCLLMNFIITTMPPLKFWT